MNILPIHIKTKAIPTRNEYYHQDINLISFYMKACVQTAFKQKFKNLAITMENILQCYVFKLLKLFSFHPARNEISCKRSQKLQLLTAPKAKKILFKKKTML